MQQEIIELETSSIEDLLKNTEIVLKKSSSIVSQPELEEQMIAEHAELDIQYEQLKFKEKLLLILKAMKLTIYFFVTKQASKEVFYFEKLKDYYQQFICQDSELSTLQRSAWAGQIGLVFAQIRHYSQAIACCKKALEFSSLSEFATQEIIASCHITLADVKLKYALELKKRGNASMLEEEKYLSCLESINISINLNPKNIKAYLIKAQLYNYLANFYDKEKKTDQVIVLLIQALQTACKGISITSSLHNQSIFIKYIVDYSNKLKNRLQSIATSKDHSLQNDARKKNIVKIIKDLERIKELSLKPIVSIDELLRNIEYINNSLLKNDSYSPFWNNSSMTTNSNQKHIPNNENAYGNIKIS